MSTKSATTSSAMMNPTDSIAVTTLVFTVIGAVAASVAAYFAWKGPTKQGLARVERNTEETAQHVDAVRGHLAEQNRRESLLDQAARVSVVVEASGFCSEPLTLIFTLKDPRATLVRIELVNKLGAASGTASCAQVELLVFSATIESVVAGRWFTQCDIQGTLETRLVRIRAFLEIEGSETQRTISATMWRQLKSKTPSASYEYGFTLSSGS